MGLNILNTGQDIGENMETSMCVTESGVFGEVICSGQEREKQEWNENTSSSTQLKERRKLISLHPIHSQLFS